MRRGWKVVGGRVLVRDGANLPVTVCLVSGQATSEPPVWTEVEYRSPAEKAARVVLGLSGVRFDRRVVARVLHGVSRREHGMRRSGRGLLFASLGAAVTGAVASLVVGDGSVLFVGLGVGVIGALVGGRLSRPPLEASAREADWLVLDVGPTVVRALEAAAEEEDDDE